MYKQWIRLVFVLVIVLSLCSCNKRTDEPQIDLENCSPQPITIAIVDSGFSKEGIKDIQAHFCADENNQDEILNWNFVEGDSDIILDDNALTHGDVVVKSFVNTINEMDLGVTYELILLKVLDEDGKCKNSDIIEAIQYAEKNGAQICNLSISTYSDDPELRETLENSEMLFVVAAGNEGENLDAQFPSYPTKWKLDNVISVAAVDRKGELLEMSNYGADSVDVASMGIVEENLILGEGTSFSTPKVAAIATTIWSAKPHFKANEVKAFVVSIAKRTNKLKDLVKYGELTLEDVVVAIYE